VRAGALASAHDVAEGGLAVALAESCVAGGLGAVVQLTVAGPVEKTLFGEGPGGFVVSGPAEAIETLCASRGARRIGTVGGARLTIRVADGEAPDSLSLSLRDLSGAYSEGLAEHFA
jgi:phosphoribosylformylglycinamidine (FGAM) synthase-like enzyme